MWVSMFFFFFFMQKELGESMRMFEVPELEDSGIGFCT